MKTETISVVRIAHLVQMDEDTWDRIKAWLHAHGVEVRERPGKGRAR